MIDRIRFAQYPVEHSSKWLSLSRDHTTMQIRLNNRWLLIFLQTKPA